MPPLTTTMLVRATPETLISSGQVRRSSVAARTPVNGSAASSTASSSDGVSGSLVTTRPTSTTIAAVSLATGLRRARAACESGASGVSRLMA